MDNLKEAKKLYQFDVLRGIAIIGVFFVHIQYTIHPDFDFSYGKYFINVPKENEYFKYLSLSPFAFGWMGVILFFIISGFLIHYVSLKKGIENFDLKSFFLKRFWRIYPPYLIFLLFFTFNNRSVGSIISHPFDFLSHVFFFHTFTPEYFFSINGVFWSLAIEVHLYILYPLFLLIRKKIGINNTIYLLGFIHLIISLIWWITSDCNNIVIGNIALRHWFTWSVGAYLAESYYYNTPCLKKIPLSLVMAIFLLFYISKIFVIHKLTDAVFSTLIIAVLVEKYLFQSYDYRLKFWEKALIPIGLCSYSLYLIHLPMMQQLYKSINFFNVNTINLNLIWFVNTIPIFVIIFFVSYSSYLFIEQNSLLIGSNYFKEKSKSNL